MDNNDKGKMEGEVGRGRLRTQFIKQTVEDEQLQRSENNNDRQKSQLTNLRIIKERIFLCMCE